VTLADALAAALEAGREHAGEDEEVVAVMPAEPGTGARVYLLAFCRGGELSYLALDGALAPVRDPRLLRDAVSVIAMAERADEASGAVAAEELAGLLADARAQLEAAGQDDAAAAAAAVATGLAELAEAAAGPRVATPHYLDEIAARARALEGPMEELRVHAEAISHRLSGMPDDPLEPAARALWALVGAYSAVADPGGFALAMAASSGAVEALAADVLARYRIPAEPG
jgi:hypothetical protein